MKPTVKAILLTLMFLAMMPATASAQKNRAERDAWLKEITRCKHEYLAKELELSEAQQKAFFPLYDAMEAESRRAVDETHRMEKEIAAKGEKATDTELEKCAEAQFELRGKENAIEMKYLARFKSVLTPRQLFKLKSAERKFNRKLFKEHRRKRDGGKHKK